MYFSKVYLHIFYFLQRIFSYIFETSLPHILIRRYVLILTAYKFLDVEIVVGPTSHVEITNDNRGNRIILPHATWKASIELCRYWAINAVNCLRSSSHQDLNIELVKVCDTKNVKLSLHDTYLYLKSTTVLFLFVVEQCVEHAYYKLSQCTHGVSKNSNILYHF